MITIGIMMLSAFVLAGISGYRSSNNTMKKEVENNNQTISIPLKDTTPYLSEEFKIVGEGMNENISDIFKDVPFPKAARRLQQILKRRDVKIKQAFSELAYEQKELAFGKLVLEAGEKFLSARDERLMVKDDLIKLKEEAVNIREDSLDQIKKNIDLISREKELDFRTRELEIDFKEKDLKLQNKSLEHMMQDIQLEGKLVNINKKEAELNLTIREINILQAQNLNKLNETMLQLKNIQNEIVFKEAKQDLKHRENLIELKSEALSNYESFINSRYDLALKSIQLEDKESKLLYRERKVKLDNLYQRTVNVLTRWKSFTWNESPIEQFDRHEWMFDKFMKHHFEWLHLP